MTARVNLLPGTVRERDAAGRQRILAAVVVLLVLAGLGGATLWQRSIFAEAEEELADAQAELTAARQEVAELAMYEDLERRLAETDSLLTSVMVDEATLAGILQDIALVTPSEGAFTSMQVNFDYENPSVVGTFTGGAEVLHSHAPGVERFLLDLDRAAGFRNPYPGGSAIDEEDIATFSVTVQLGREYVTERYNDGLPEGLR